MEGDFERVVAFASIGDGAYVEAQVGGHPVLVARFGEAAFAVEDVCSHADSPLHGGRLRGGRIGCPLHGAMFDMKTGAAIGGGLAPCGVRTFAARVRDGWVELNPAPIPGLPR